MSNIIKYINENFSSFEQVKQNLKKEPYSLSIKETEDIYMLCFTESSDLSIPAVRECTGIILEKETNKLIHYSFEKCYEGLRNSNWAAASSEEKNKIQKDYYDYNFDCNVNIKSLLETNRFTLNLFFIGSIIKLFYYKGKWEIATSKNIEAEKSFWVSKRSFKDLFIEAIEETYSCTFEIFCEKIDPNCAYTYLLQHPENCTIVKVAQPFAFILNKVDLETIKETIPDKDSFQLDSSTHDISEQNNYLLYEHDTEGNVINRIKLLSTSYQTLKDAFGNHPNIGLRYIECKMEDFKKSKLLTGNLKGKKLLTNTNCRNLRKVFTGIADVSLFNKIDLLLERACKNILKSYTNVFVLKTRQLVDTPKNQYKILKKLEKKVDSDPEIVVTEDTIKEILYSNKNMREIAYHITFIYP